VNQDGARSCPNPRRYDMGSFRGLNISTPTLRKVREGWGTHGAGCASKIKTWVTGLEPKIKGSGQECPLYTTSGCSRPLQERLLLQLRRKAAVDCRSHFGHQALAVSEIGGLDGIVKLDRHHPRTNRKPRFRHDCFGA